MSRLKAKAPELTGTGKAKGMLYGASGVGKTWFALTFPAPYYIDTEGGADLRHYQERLKASGGAYMGPEDGALDFNTIIDQMQTLATEQHPYKTLVVDSITKVYQATIAQEQERLGDKDAFGASKKPAVAAMRRLANWATRLDMNIWFIAHETSEWALDATTNQRVEIGKAPDVWDKLVYELDLTLWVRRTGAAYPAKATVRKSRLTGFPNGETFQLTYEDFSGRYGKDFIEAAAKTVTLASSEQVAEIERLVDLLKITPEDAEKVLTKAGADTWAEMSTEHAAKTVAWLMGKIKGEETTGKKGAKS
jgi:hypothetical protein